MDILIPKRKNHYLIGLLQCPMVPKLGLVSYLGRVHQNYSNEGKFSTYSRVQMDQFAAFVIMYIGSKFLNNRYPFYLSYGYGTSLTTLKLD